MDEKLMEQLVTRTCIQDEEYWKKKKKHRFSVAYRRKKRKALWEFRRAMRAEGTYAERRSQKKKFVAMLVAAVGCFAVVGCFAAALLANVNTTAKDSEQHRLGEVVICQFEDHIQFLADESNPKLWKLCEEESDTAEFVKKEMRYVPEGYEMVSESGGECFGYYSASYENADQNYLHYMQCEYEMLLCSAMSTDGEELKKVQVDGKDGYFVPDGDFKRIIWTDGTYYYTINGKFTEELLLEMAVNVN